MPIKVACGHCGQGLSAPDAALGKRAKCPKCGNAVLIAAPGVPHTPPVGMPVPIARAVPAPQAPPASSLLSDMFDEDEGYAREHPAAPRHSDDEGFDDRPRKSSQRWDSADVPDEVLKQIRYGWIAGLVSGTLTLMIVLIAMQVKQPIPGFDPELAWIDVGLIYLLAVGIFFRSRIAATLMFVYFLAAKLYLIFATGNLVSIPVTLAFLYVYFRAMMATFQYQGIVRGKVDGGSFKRTSKATNEAERLSGWDQFKRYAWIGIVVGVSDGVRQLMKHHDQQPPAPQVQQAQPAAMPQQRVAMPQPPAPQMPPVPQHPPGLGNAPAANGSDPTAGRPSPDRLADVRARHEKMRREAQQRVEEQRKRMEQLPSAQPPTSVPSQAAPEQAAASSAPVPKNPLDPPPAQASMPEPPRSERPALTQPAMPKSPPQPAEELAGETEVLGGGMDLMGRDVAPKEGLLVGLKVGLGRAFGSEVIQAIRPIYRVGEKESLGKQCGVPQTRVLTEKAKPGYGVGAITVKAGLIADGFSVTYMRIDGDRLDPSDSYESDWLGGTGGAAPKRLGGDGRWVLGVVAKLSNNRCTGIGLLYDRSLASRDR
jgi:hypothetical protein